MKYSVRYAHLDSKPYVSVGETVKSGNLIGVTGNTGASDGVHLHIDCVHGYQKEPWKLYDMEIGKKKPCPKQLNYFIDDDLFMSPICITTPYCDAEYMRNYKKLHCAYDVVPEDRESYNIHWNRSKLGKVLYSDFDSGLKLNFSYNSL
jgi:hypothetical protein